LGSNHAIYDYIHQLSALLKKRSLIPKKVEIKLLCSGNNQKSFSFLIENKKLSKKHKPASRKDAGHV
jgi:hypothetical protein